MDDEEIRGTLLSKIVILVLYCITISSQGYCNINCLGVGAWLKVNTRALGRGAL